MIDESLTQCLHGVRSAYHGQVAHLLQSLFMDLFNANSDAFNDVSIELLAFFIRFNRVEKLVWQQQTWLLEPNHASSQP